MLVWVLDLLGDQKYSFFILGLYILQTHIILLLWSAIYFGLQYARNYKQSEIEKWKLEALAKDAALASLKEQINPHFLFNSLNNIRALVLEDAEKSREMTSRLAELLRYILLHNQNATASLEEEIKIVRDYLELESIQLEDRLRFTITASPDANTCQIPPMSIQFLVENAIKHGINGRPDGGLIRVQAKQQEHTLHIEVTNTGQIETGLKNTTSIGLDNLKSRFALLFGSAATPSDSRLRAMKALIVEDSRLARQELKHLLSNFPEIISIEEASNAQEAINLISSSHYDILFLDIQMPGKNGFELLEELDEVPPVIFVTAYDEYAIKAFDCNALDYLLKPLQKDRLAAAISKVVEFQRQTLNSRTTASEILTQDSQIFVKDGDACWFVKLSQVRLLEVVGSYTQLFFDNHQPTIPKTLNHLESRLDPKTFFRANRQQIVNLKWIDKVEPWFSSTLKLTLKTGETIDISRRQTTQLKTLLGL